MKKEVVIIRPAELDEASFKYGISVAAELASEYDTSSIHPYRLQDCILAKLNLLPKGRIRKNLNAQKINEAITSLERKVDSLEATMRFIVGVSKSKRKPLKVSKKKDRCICASGFGLNLSCTAHPGRK